MTYSFSRKQVGLAVSFALALGAFSSTARADSTEAGYLTDQRGTVVRSGFGLCWRAGSNPSQEAMDECDPKPVQVAQLVAPAPKAPVAAPMPAGERLTLDADMLFDFNKSTLRPAGQTALDEFLAKMKGIDPEVIVVVGHADRFGTNSYNQRLSEQRAAAVSTYLQGKGVAANRIKTEGRGETQPVTKPGDCKGKKSVKVIACLQPDRRVDIEVVGTRLAQ